MNVSQWEDVHFLSHVNIKNIIGKELINDDNVAVMELVKNSYDAGAKKVTVEFKKLKENRENHELLIIDDGNGMSKEDILHKWLNLAYSIKRVRNSQNNRLQAGNKGIGRFSCDRLGKKLDIYTKKDSEIYQLQINWEDFENITDHNVQINHIPMKLRNVSNNEVKQETGYEIENNGTIIKISDLRIQWINFNEKSLLKEPLNFQRVITLKATLEKLINKSQVESDDFKIFLKVSEIDDTNETSYNKKINGEIKNNFFEKLNFNTTYIHSAISNDGQYIITKLKDRDEVVFKTIEKNIEFPELKNVKIILMHLNPYGKAYFKKQIGVRSVDFGSIYLFINGFRIPPYGEIDNDSFGIEIRKGQGQRRYLGGREIIGRIEIEDRDNQFKIISSREGIEQNEAFKQLVHKSTKSRKDQIKNNGFFYKTLKRLEKYVVQGLKWDSVPREYTEAKIDSLITEDNWTDNKEVYILSLEKKLNNISKNIFSFIGVDAKTIIDLDINKKVLSFLIESDNITTKTNISKFLSIFGQIPIYSINDNLKKNIEKLIKNIDDENLVKKFDFITNNKLKIVDNILNREETYQQLDKKIKILEDEQKTLKQELKTVKTAKKQIEQQVTYLKSITSKDTKELVAFQHHIGLYANTAKNFTLDSIDLLSNKFDFEKDILKKLQKIILELDKIKIISKYITRDDFLSTAKKVEIDLVEFIFNYIKSIYEITTNQEFNIEIKTNNIVHICKFEPIKINIILDNLLSNSKKEQIDARHVQIIFSKEKNDLLMEYIDDGRGLDSSIVDKDSIFEMGVTTTNGSGLGLYHVKELLKEMKSDISAERQNIGIKFLIRFKI